MRAFVAVRNILVTAKENDPITAIQDRIKVLEKGSEETLAAINDLSEDTRKEFDDIYLALAELAVKQKGTNQPRRPIGLHPHNTKPFRKACLTNKVLIRHPEPSL